jgi:hypothetical protein
VEEPAALAPPARRQWLRDSAAAARHDRTTEAEHRLGIHPHDDPKETNK